MCSIAIVVAKNGNWFIFFQFILRNADFGFETHGEDHTKSKIGAIIDPTKWTLALQNLKKNVNLTERVILWY